MPVCVITLPGTVSPKTVSERLDLSFGIFARRGEKYSCYPYFHNGSVWELDKAVNIMAKAQLGKTLAPEDTENIVAFLKALSGNVPESARTMPELPVSHDVKSQPDNK